MGAQAIERPIEQLSLQLPLRISKSYVSIPASGSSHDITFTPRAVNDYATNEILILSIVSPASRKRPDCSPALKLFPLVQPQTTAVVARAELFTWTAALQNSASLAWTAALQNAASLAWTAALQNAASLAWTAALQNAASLAWTAALQNAAS